MLIELGSYYVMKIAVRDNTRSELLNFEPIIVTMVRIIGHHQCPADQSYEGTAVVVGMTVTFTIALSDTPVVSMTINLKNMVVLENTFGAINVALDVSVPFNTTVGPAICVQLKVIGLPSGE